MSLDDQVLATQKVCNLNLHNLRLIGSKLPHALKVQLVHYCIFSVLDYCNCTYGALSCSNLQKLQKIQNDATRFIFNINQLITSELPQSNLNVTCIRGFDRFLDHDEFLSRELSRVKTV